MKPTASSSSHGFKDECGVFGVFQHPEAANLTYLGLHALQHRGQESAGIVTTDGERLHASRHMGRVAESFTPDALARLMEYDWPGNVRELETTIEHAIPSSSGSVLGIDDLPAFPERSEGNRSGPRIPGSTIQEIEREAILRTLEQVGGSTTRAAKALNMSVRKIQYKLKEYRLTAASTLLVETVPSPSVERPVVPTKRAVFVVRNDSSD